MVSLDYRANANDTYSIHFNTHSSEADISNSTAAANNLIWQK